MSLSGLIFFNYSLGTEHGLEDLECTKLSQRATPSAPLLGVLYGIVQDLSTLLFDTGLFIGLDLDEAGLRGQQAQGPTCLHLTTERTPRPDSSG